MNILTITPMYGEYIINHSFMFIIALLTLASVVLLRSKGMFLLQLALLVSMVFVDWANSNVFMGILVVIQPLFTLLVIYHVKKAIDRNYQLVLEKTHTVKRQITEHNYTGGQKSFF